MKILHVASFNGNIGDVLSHAGLYRILERDLGIFSNIIERLDLRRFYKIEGEYRLKFNLECAQMFNAYDLIIIGGGGFLKQQFESSISGNTFDFDAEFLRTLKSRVLFCSIGGVNPFDTVSSTAFQKTEAFLRMIASDERFMLLLRSDGSLKNSFVLRELQASKADNINEIFDSAYLNQGLLKKLKSNSVVINIGYDQAVAYEKGITDVISRTANLVKAIHEIDQAAMIYFVPHTYYDVRSFVNLYEALPEAINRNNLKCLETFTMMGDLRGIIDVYSRARLVLTGRFHSAAFAFLYNGNFLPLYKFDRTECQLKALGMRLPIGPDLDEYIEAYHLPEKLRQMRVRCDDGLKLNRDKTGKYLARFLADKL